MKCLIYLQFFLVFLLFNKVTNNNLQKPYERKSQSSKKDLIVSSEVNTLLEVPVTSTTSISYYYPYFYKTHLITFADEVDTTILIEKCFVPGCSWCSASDPYVCLKCSTGFFLAEDACVTWCPEGYYSDILRSKCVPATTIVTEVIFTKAYSTGSCKNTCGKMMEDCSCSSTCKGQGSCCTDYISQNCDELGKKSQNVDCKLNENCLYCDDKTKLINSETPSCNQCKDNFFLYEGRCNQVCPEGTSPDTKNSICVKIPTIENCEEVNLVGKCKQCKKGFFLYNNSCLRKCPSGYRADRITWTCLEAPVFAWYWIYPSRSSCKNYCGIIIEESDCSCSSDCFFYGNCCQDIEYFCNDLIFWRKADSPKATSLKSAKKANSIPLPKKEQKSNSNSSITLSNNK
jgi:hypothetical protein